MDSRAKWLLTRQNYLKARKGVLETWISLVNSNTISDEDIIDSMTFSHNTGSDIQHVPSQKSRTEYIALNLGTAYTSEQQIREESVKQWKNELRVVRYWLSLLDAVFLSLTTEERTLAEFYYCEKKSIDVIAQSPITDVIRSRSTIKRMLKRIVAKVDEVINTVDPQVFNHK